MILGTCGSTSWQGFLLRYIGSTSRARRRVGSGAGGMAAVVIGSSTQLKMMVATKRGRYLGTYARVEPVVQPISHFAGRFLPYPGDGIGDQERGNGA